MGIYKTSDQQQPKRLTQKPHKIPTKQAKTNIELLCVCVSHGTLEEAAIKLLVMKKLSM